MVQVNNKSQIFHIQSIRLLSESQPGAKDVCRLGNQKVPCLKPVWATNFFLERYSMSGDYSINWISCDNYPRNSYLWHQRGQTKAVDYRDIMCSLYKGVSDLKPGFLWIFGKKFWNFEFLFSCQTELFYWQRSQCN